MYYPGDRFTPKMPYKGFNLSRSRDPSAELTVEKVLSTQFGLGSSQAGAVSLPAWLAVPGPTRQKVVPPSVDIIALSQDQVSSFPMYSEREVNFLGSEELCVRSVVIPGHVQ